MPGAHHQLALVGLADVDVHGVRHDHLVEHGLHELRHERLERVALDRQAQADHVREDGRVTGRRKRDAVRAGWARGTSERR